LAIPYRYLANALWISCDTKSHCCCAKAAAQHAANSRIRMTICSIGNGNWYDTKSHCCCVKVVAQHAANSRIRTTICNIGNGNWYDNPKLNCYNGVNRRKVTVVATQRQCQRRFASIPVGGSRNEGAALALRASNLDKQDDFKVDWL
jgi:hypothetical protein